MNRNQKIALGCGGGGCLILILAVVAVGALIATGVIKAPGLTSYTDSESDSNSNETSNSNRNSNSNSSNRNSASNENENRSASSSSMSDDDKHKLYQAAAGTRDHELIRTVSQKLGLVKEDGYSYTDEYAPFFKDHIAWIFKNTDFMQTIDTPEKARAYVAEHIDD